MNPEELQAKFEELWHVAYGLLWSVHHMSIWHDSGIPENCANPACRDALKVLGNEP